jgi:predicted RND superfamily exporter protein
MSDSVFLNFIFEYKYIIFLLLFVLTLFIYYFYHKSKITENNENNNLEKLNNYYILDSESNLVKVNDIINNNIIPEKKNIKNKKQKVEEPVSDSSELESN